MDLRVWFLAVGLMGGCAYNPSPDELQILASMTTERAVQTVARNLENRDAEGLGMCAVPGFNRDTRKPRFKAADAERFTYLDNHGGGACTNDCPDPDHEFAVNYRDIKRVFVSKTSTSSRCRHGEGLDVIQIVGKHEDRTFVMSTLRSTELPVMLAALKHLNPNIALKNSY
jgi:hypothetical protein